MDEEAYLMLDDIRVNTTAYVLMINSKAGVLGRWLNP